MFLLIIKLIVNKLVWAGQWLSLLFYKWWILYYTKVLLSENVNDRLKKKMPWNSRGMPILIPLSLFFILPRYLVLMVHFSPPLSQSCLFSVESAERPTYSVIPFFQGHLFHHIISWDQGLNTQRIKSPQTKTRRGCLHIKMNFVLLLLIPKVYFYLFLWTIKKI